MRRPRKDVVQRDKRFYLSQTNLLFIINWTVPIHVRHIINHRFNVATFARRWFPSAIHALVSVATSTRCSAPGVLASLLLSVACVADADDFASKRADVLALGQLTQPPAMMDAEGFERTETIRPIYYDALDYEGRPTKVFAWLGLPSNRSGKVPGIVLVHGGGGTAFRQWVEKWNEKGFAAIAIAHEGQAERREAPRKWAKHQWPGPPRAGHYQDVSKPLQDQWMYHALADTILANSLLRSLPEVDQDKVGVMGVSWGGVITSTVMGIDTRFAFTIPTYGCGKMADVDNHWGAALGDNTFYRQVWDPLHYLPNATMPTLWFSWPQDNHFPLDSQAASYRAMSGEFLVALLPGMRHSTAAAWNPPDSYAFAESVVNDGKPWCRQMGTQMNGTSIQFTLSSSKPLDRAVLISTTDTGFTGNRTWVESPASLTREGEHWVATADLPEHTTSCFVNVKSGNLTISSQYVEVQQRP
ncbi:Acetyl xylan esterase (AXE1) [Stieleria maiorica]|uniref:Acetyl xylan esterase (AXE1) n=1 Tax=Stieleria maiorica TaxID=2795974 RepID=A0A5B9MGW8_9BACT|nr:Acetyl xylan esterase (AXE1) [Stieleria maiorica]